MTERAPLLDELSGSIAPNDPSLGDWTAHYYNVHRDRFLEDLRIADDRFEVGEPLLEIGAAPFFVTAALSELGHDVVGVDIAPERFSESIDRFGLTVRTCDIEHSELPFPDGTFKYILMNEVFEHLRIDPIHTMREAVRVLAPGGELLLSTPNLRSLLGVYRLLRHGEAFASNARVYEQYEKLGTLGHMGHVREYTPVEVERFLGHFGVNVVDVIYRGSGTRVLSRALYKVVPAARPYFTIIGQKGK